jgi:diketogulonate reductase-like aldo/keto reductase
VFQAYSSLGTSDKNLTKKLIENSTVMSLAHKYSKSPAQLLLKWSLQQDIGKLSHKIRGLS